MESRRKLRDLLLEIGVEEIPPRQLPDLALQLTRAAKAELREEHLSYRGVIVQYTLRRLALHILQIDEQQNDIVRDIKGPPKRAAFDAQGQPTQAALGFCRSQGARPEDLVVRTLAEGEYCFLQERQRGRPTIGLLPELLPRVIERLVPRETMRWDDSGLRFVRPIRWLLCLYGDKPVSFSYGRLRAGSLTYSHRALGASQIEIKDTQDYFKQLKANGVVLHPSVRRAQVESDLRAIADQIRAQPLASPDLIAEIADNLEHPSPVLGRFSEKFLNLPPEVLATTLVEHQKFVPFALGSQASPYFVGFRDGGADEDGTVRAGYERVVGARLTDSQFFFELDRQTPLVERTRELRSVVYQEKLGSVWDKVRRIRKLAQMIAEQVGLSDLEALDRAAFLCKADLLTAMVGEFPTLQGVIGGVYAKLEGESDAVALAIREHYRPRTAEDELPESKVGIALSLADKLDTLICSLSIGEEPTGSRDPFGLRRAAYAIIHIVLHRLLPLDFYELIHQAEELYHSIPDRRPITVVEDFLSGRLYQVLRQQYGIAYDVLDAVTAAHDGNFGRVLQKVRSLEMIRGAERFRSLVIAFSRACHITRDQSAHGFVPRLFREEAERELWRAYLKAEGQIKPLLACGDFPGVIEQLVALRQPIDRYFDDVLVMAPDRELRQNRLGFLRAIVELFLNIGDLSRIVVEGKEEERDAQRLG